MQNQIALLLSEARRDEPRLVARLDVLAQQDGDAVYREDLRQLVGKDFPPAQAASCWREALTRVGLQFQAPREALAGILSASAPGG